jgi:glycosyltransferase involved in cell wall biosynthesis
MAADLWAGAEVQLATLASYLRRRPDVELLAVLFNEGALACELRALGVSVTVLDEQRNGSIQLLAALTGFLRDHPVDVVHTHKPKDNVLGAAAARLANVPCLVRTVHGRSEPMRGWARARYRLYDALDTSVLRWSADRIIAVSGCVSATLERRGCRRPSIVHLPNGIDLTKVRPARGRDEMRRELGIGPEAPVVGTVGRLSPVKGHIHLLKAARRILDTNRAARFVIVGDGPLRRELTAAAAQLGIDHACAFVGARTDVYDLMAAMDVFVLPSLDEGIPMALLEAMALGRPVVATAVGGVPEVLRHRLTGLLVESADERAMAQACLELVCDAAGAAMLGARARDLVERRFSHETNGQALIDVYRSVVAGSSRAATRLRLTCLRALHPELACVGDAGTVVPDQTAGRRSAGPCRNPQHKRAAAGKA